MKTSKYINVVIPGNWKVVTRVSNANKHSTFILAKKTKTNTYILSLADSALSNVMTGKRTVQSYIEGKNFLASRNVRKVANTVSVL